MYKKELLFVVLFAVLISCLFFAKVIFLRQIPFPGDLLANTTPFKTQSYLGYAPGGYPDKGQGRDVIAQSLPWRYLTVSQIRHGQFPLWNPYNFSGNAHIGDFQTGAFYPLSFVFFLFPFSAAWTIFIILQPILGVEFMYLFLRVLEKKKVSSFIGGVAFGFCSYMVVWMEYGNIDHALLWLPLLLFASAKYLKTQKKSFLVLFILAGAMCLLAGYIQGAFYVLVTAILYSGGLLLQQKKLKSKQSLFLVGSCILMGLIAAVQILPTLVIFSHSTRGNYTQLQIQNLLQPWYYLVTVFSSDFFGNPATRNFYLPITYFERVMYVSVALLFFAFYGLRKIKIFEVKFFAIFSGVILILTTNIPGVSWFYQLPIPVIATTVPTRLLSIFAFCLIVLSVYGIDLWWEEKKAKHIVPLIFIGIYMTLWIVVMTLPKIYPELAATLAITKHTFLLSTILAFATIGVFYLKKFNRQISMFILSILIVMDLFYVFIKFTPFAPATLLYPTTPVISYLQEHAGIYRSWGYGNAYIPANYATAFGIYAADGYDPLHNVDYNRLLNSSATGKIKLPLSRGDANIAPGSGFGRLPDNVYRQKILNVLGVKYILHMPFSGEVSKAETGVFPESDYKLLWHDNSYQIYQNLQVFSRFFLVGNFKRTSFTSDIKDFYAADLKSTILLYEQPDLLPQKGSGKVVLQSYQPNAIRLATQTTTNQFLFLSDTYDSGWKAIIDGRPAKLYKADVAFKAVEVPKGKHTVVFSYQPLSFRIGLVISVITTIVGVGYLFLRKLLKGDL